MRTSGQGIRFIQSFEKLVLEPYNDQAGRQTIGYGHLIARGEDFSSGIDADQADQLFVSDLTKVAENPVNMVIDVDIEQNQFDALVSLCFNIGSGNFQKSRLAALVNNGVDDPDVIRSAFIGWDKISVSGVLVPSAGLLDRRNAEADIYIKNVYNNHK